MHHHPVLRAARLALSLSVGTAAIAAVPAAAHAAGFGQPVVISGRDDAGAPQIAVAPSGRTAVLYDVFATQGHKTVHTFRVAIGPSADHLAAPKTFTAGAHAAATYGNAQLLARPDGGFVACFQDGRGKTATQACSIAPPTGDFGPAITVGTVSLAAQPHMLAAVRPDNSVVLVMTTISTSPTGSAITGASTSSAILSPAGVVGPMTPVDDSVEEAIAATSTAVLDDGTVALSTRVPLTSGKPGGSPAVRLLAPGASQFGPPVPVSKDPEQYDAELTGGKHLLVKYATNGAKNTDPVLVRFASRSADGTFAAPLALPGAQTGEAGGQAVLLPNGSFLGIRATQRTDPKQPDCLNQTAGAVSAGPLAAIGKPTKAALLSDSHQIALHPQVVALADGTVVVAWENAASVSAAARVEVAVRRPGSTAFAKPQVLPALGHLGTIELIASGDRAALAWQTLSRGVAVSTLRTAAPYSMSTALPSHPAAPCDE